MSAAPQVAGALVPQTPRLAGSRHASTRLLPVSATYMMGGETLVSKAILDGVLSSRPSIKLGVAEVMGRASACWAKLPRRHAVHDDLCPSLL